MTDLVRSAAPRQLVRAAASPSGEDVTRRAASSRLATRWCGVLVRITVRILVALGLALLAFVFLEAWLPGVVLETFDSWFSG
jgi:hypothetical protein